MPYKNQFLLDFTVFSGKNRQKFVFSIKNEKKFRKYRKSSYIVLYIILI